MSDRQSMKDTDNISPMLYGEETKKAIANFQFSNAKFPPVFLSCLTKLKCACAKSNGMLGRLDIHMADAIANAALEVSKEEYIDQFPVDIYQTGSGTSINMNCNEVIANLINTCSEQGYSAHPNDHVNLGQSSNDVIPSCIHLSAVTLGFNKLLPAMSELVSSLERIANENTNTFKTARTHLMDAVPMRFSQEIGAWASQVKFSSSLILQALENLRNIPIGGTAVGTGINTHPEFAKKVTAILSQDIQIELEPAKDPFHLISTQDFALNLSSQLKTTAISISKFVEDIRWYSSGPLAGLNEISLSERQKGSSIMPGKVNPVIPEAVLMALTKVIGNDATISLAAKSGNFQLNTMLPLIAHCLIESIELLTTAIEHLDAKVIRDLQINKKKVAETLQRNPILVTALVDRLGYDLCSKIAKKAYADGKPIIDVALALSDIKRDELEKLLDPAKLCDS